MLFSGRCCAQVARFLATGAFAHPATGDPHVAAVYDRS
jgi:hypothetical protein